MPEATTYDPSNEPYLGRQSVFHFDNMISVAMEASAPIAAYTHQANLSRLQKAATEIIPHGFSLALSIRELVRQGYLVENPFAGWRARIGASTGEEMSEGLAPLPAG